MLKDFKEFAMRGNVVDLAIGVIIGAAFGKIVSSLVQDVIMPPIGYLTGGVDFSRLVLTIKKASDGVAAITINYGIFINTIVDFVIIALVIFILVKQINKLKKQEAKQLVEPPKPSKEEILLTEIRDLLKKSSSL